MFRILNDIAQGYNMCFPFTYCLLITGNISFHYFILTVFFLIGTHLHKTNTYTYIITLSNYNSNYTFVTYINTFISLKSLRLIIKHLLNYYDTFYLSYRLLFIFHEGLLIIVNPCYFCVNLFFLLTVNNLFCLQFSFNETLSVLLYFSSTDGSQ